MMMLDGTTPELGVLRTPLQAAGEAMRAQVEASRQVQAIGHVVVPELFARQPRETRVAYPPKWPDFLLGELRESD